MNNKNMVWLLIVAMVMVPLFQSESNGIPDNDGGAGERSYSSHINGSAMWSDNLNARSAVSVGADDNVSLVCDGYESAVFYGNVTFDAYPYLDYDYTDDFSGLWSALSGVPSGFADNVDNDTDTVDTNWDNLTNVPAGFADNVDNDTTDIEAMSNGTWGFIFTAHNRSDLSLVYSWGNHSEVGYLMSPSGSNGYVPFLSGGALATDSAFCWNDANNQLLIGKDYDWYNDSYKHFKVLNIDNDGYTGWLNITCIVKYAEDDGGHCNCSSHCNADFSDVHFVQIDNSTVIPFKLESYVSADYGTFSVNITASAMADERMIVYYGGD